MESDPYIREIQDQVAAQPGDMALRLKLGTAFIERQRYRDALQELQKARQCGQLSAEAMRLQEIVYAKLGLRE